MKNFTSIVEINNDLYNNHPTAHAYLTAALAVGGVVASRKIIRRIVRQDNIVKH